MKREEVKNRIKATLYKVDNQTIKVKEAAEEVMIVIDSFVKHESRKSIKQS